MTGSDLKPEWRAELERLGVEGVRLELFHRQRIVFQQPTDHLGGFYMASASLHPLETVFSASALIRPLTRLSSVACLKVLLVPCRALVVRRPAHCLA